MNVCLRVLWSCVLASTLWVAAPHGAAAQCTILLRNVDRIRFTSADVYSVFDPVDAELTASFDVRHRRSDPCDYFIGFTTGQSGSYDRRMIGDASELAYQLYDTPARTNVLKNVPEAANGEVISGTFTTDQVETNSHSYVAVIPRHQLIGNGLYTDQVDLVLYEGTLSSFAERHRKTVNIRARILADLQACFGDCSSVFDPEALGGTIDFGDLTVGMTRTADVWVRANTDYSIRIASDNRGVLQHTTQYSSEVPYTLTVNGIPVDITRLSVRLDDGIGPTPVGGVPYALAFQIDSTAAAWAGLHRDHVTITFRSLR